MITDLIARLTRPTRELREIATRALGAVQPAIGLSASYRLDLFHGGKDDRASGESDRP